MRDAVAIVAAMRAGREDEMLRIAFEARGESVVAWNLAAVCNALLLAYERRTGHSGDEFLREFAASLAATIEDYNDGDGRE